jgi:crotonobetaine/carnitine-CoA ligase
MSERIPITIADLIEQKLPAHRDLDVLTFEHAGEAEVRTYGQLWENGQRVARMLQQRGLERGERIALLLLNHPEFVEVMVGAAIAGVEFVPIDSRARGARLAYMLRDSNCRGVICGEYALEGLLEATAHEVPVQWCCVLGGAVPQTTQRASFEIVPFDTVLHSPLHELAPRNVVTEPTTPMQVMYTSGTTGDPKGIVIPHARFMTVAGHGDTVFGYRRGDRPYTGLSLTHGNAQFATLATSLKMALRAVISRKFTKSQLWNIVRKHGCTTFTLLGGMATAIYSEPRRDDDANNPVRLIVSAGMPAAIWRAFEQRFGVDVLEFYAAMEGGMSLKPVGQGPIGSCGRVTPGLIAKVVDDDGNEVPPGTPGELWFRLESGPFPPVAYLNNPEASAKKTAGGWLHSGDIVRMNAEGWIFYEHRKGGGLRRNGEFIQPAFVEKTLAEHSSVDDVFVYGIPAENGAPGEKDIVAAIVVRDAQSFDPRTLLAWLKTRLEPNAVPTFIQRVTQIPKTASEKPQERFLVKLLKEKPESVTRTNNLA